jgi:hypothetical protein
MCNSSRKVEELRSETKEYRKGIPTVEERRTSEC